VVMILNLENQADAADKVRARRASGARETGVRRRREKKRATERESSTLALDHGIFTHESRRSNASVLYCSLRNFLHDKKNTQLTLLTICVFFLLHAKVLREQCSTPLFTIIL
jgi:hypothetical protein